ncbi:MAG: methyltransferase domain-containing protein [Myxococcales bacterium]|nr:class I SAM-dependent methyltransferase [Myxococcota bacterium]MDW8280665.1 methyltransferase domain-containing protein [Myxococcales bacterium]
MVSSSQPHASASQPDGMAAANQRTYRSLSTVLSYRLRSRLQPPERTLLELLRREGLSGWRLLDIGVGGGRTTVHFAPAARQYVGVDYSDRMIRACQRRFPERAASFQVCDVRHMDAFASGSFDVVLFSFNGLDCISPQDRMEALREIRRVLVPGGRFCFSAHNILALDLRILPPQLSWNPLELAGRLYRNIMISRLNGREALDGIHSRPFQVLREPYGVQICYVRPSYQLAQLREAGFSEVRAFGLADGREIPAEEDLDRRRDAWIYYLCR